MKGLVLKSKKLGQIVTLYDDVDHDLISQYKWYPFKNGNTIYVMSTRRKSTGKSILMHRLIMGVTDPKILVDHKNRCGIDNTRDNLRIANRQQNTANTPSWSTNSSGYKGVDRVNNKYRARIYVHGKTIHLGMFDNEVDAAKSYNVAAVQFFGEFACINNVTSAS